MAVRFRLPAVELAEEGDDIVMSNRRPDVSSRWNLQLDEGACWPKVKKGVRSDRLRGKVTSFPRINYFDQVRQWNYLIMEPKQKPQVRKLYFESEKRETVSTC